MTGYVPHCRLNAVDGKVVVSPLFCGFVSIRASKRFSGMVVSPMPWCPIKDCPWGVSGEVNVLNVLLDRWFMFVLVVIRWSTVFVIQKLLLKGSQTSKNIDIEGHNQDVVIEEFLDELPAVHDVVCLMLLPRWSVHFSFFSLLEILQGFVLPTIWGRSQGIGVTSSNIESGDNPPGDTVWVG